MLLAQHKAIAVGLLRAGDDVASPLPCAPAHPTRSMRDVPRGRPLKLCARGARRYVQTNPPAATPLAPDDRVFVIARAENKPEACATPLSVPA